MHTASTTPALRDLSSGSDERSNNLGRKQSLVASKSMESLKLTQMLARRHEAVVDFAAAISGGALAKLKRLDLGHNNIGDEGMRALAEAMPASLQQLDVGAVDVLAQALEHRADALLQPHDDRCELRVEAVEVAQREHGALEQRLAVVGAVAGGVVRRRSRRHALVLRVSSLCRTKEPPTRY